LTVPDLSAALLPRGTMSEAQIDYLYDPEFEALVTGAAEPLLLLDFTADWCGPCIALEPIVQALATDYAGTIRIVKVDLDYSPAITDRFGVLSIPTLVVVRHGEQIARIRAPKNRQELVDWLDAIIAEIPNDTDPQAQSRPAPDEPHDAQSNLRGKVGMTSSSADRQVRSLIDEEGDPNLIPWRNRPDGPVLEWVTASELQIGDRVVQSNKYVHTVTRSEPIEDGFWALTIEDPRLVRPRPGPTDAAGRWMANVTDWMPRKRELKLVPTFLYRRIQSDDWPADEQEVQP
jgi:thioredoxin 1